MAEVLADGLMVCTVCAHLIANGEFNDGTDTAEIVAEAMAKRWPGGGLVLAQTEDGEPVFSARDCDGCGDEGAGDRFPAVQIG